MLRAHPVPRPRHRLCVARGAFFVILAMFGCTAEDERIPADSTQATETTVPAEEEQIPTDTTQAAEPVATATPAPTDYCKHFAESSGHHVLAQSEPVEYLIRDTTEYDTGLTGGDFGVLYRNGVYVDSIDLWFGLLRVPGAVLFQPISLREEAYFGTLAFLADPVYYDGVRRCFLREILPLWHDVWSSAAVIDSTLYYWGIVLRDSAWETAHWAVTYDFRDHSADSTFLFRRLYETDVNYLNQPRTQGDLIVYWAPDTFLYVDPRLQVVERTLRDR